LSVKIGLVVCQEVWQLVPAIVYWGFQGI